MDKSLLKERSLNYRQKVHDDIRRRILSRNRSYLIINSAQEKPTYTPDQRLSIILDLVFKITHSKINQSVLSKMESLFEILIDNQGQNAKIFDYVVLLSKYVIDGESTVADTNASTEEGAHLRDNLITWMLRILIELAEESIEVRYLILNSPIAKSVISESITCNNPLHLSLAASFLNSLLTHNTNNIDKFDQGSYEAVFTRALFRLHAHFAKDELICFQEETNSNCDQSDEFKMGVLDSAEGITKLIDEDSWQEFVDRSKLSALLKTAVSFLKMSKNDLQMTDTHLSLLQSLSSHISESDCDALIADSDLFGLLKGILLSSTKQMSVKQKVIFIFSNLIVASLPMAKLILSDTDTVNFLLQNVVQRQRNQASEDCLQCICNLTVFMDRFVVEFVARFDIVEFLFGFVKEVHHDSSGSTYLLIFLQALENLLRLDRQFNFQLREQMAESDKVQFIAELQYATSRSVYNKAQDILNEYFEDLID